MSDSEFIEFNNIIKRERKKKIIIKLKNFLKSQNNPKINIIKLENQLYFKANINSGSIRLKTNSIYNIA